MFDPTLGRWIQEDPIGFAGGDENLYRFEGDEPLARVDPLGLAWFESVKIQSQGTEVRLANNSFPFRTGIGIVQAYKDVSIRRLGATEDEPHSIQVKFTSDVPVEKAHWLQLISVGPIKNKGGARVDTRDSFPSGSFFNPIYDRFDEVHVDTDNQKTAFYDMVYDHIRTRNELSIFDRPAPGLVIRDYALGANQKWIADDYLMDDCKVYYHVHWEVVVTRNRFNAGLDPATELDWDYQNIWGEQVGMNLPEFLKQKKLLVGYDKTLKKKYEVDNPTP